MTGRLILVLDENTAPAGTFLPASNIIEAASGRDVFITVSSDPGSPHKKMCMDAGVAERKLSEMSFLYRPEGNRRGHAKARTLPARFVSPPKGSER